MKMSFAFEKIPRISLSCKLVPVQYRREYENGLFNQKSNFFFQNQIFPVSLVSQPLVKRNENSGYEVRASSLSLCFWFLCGSETSLTLHPRLIKTITGESVSWYGTHRCLWKQNPFFTYCGHLDCAVQHTSIFFDKSSYTQTTIAEDFSYTFASCLYNGSVKLGPSKLAEDWAEWRKENAQRTVTRRYELLDCCINCSKVLRACQAPSARLQSPWLLKLLLVLQDSSVEAQYVRMKQ